jgi:hypothetical protein
MARLHPEVVFQSMKMPRLAVQSVVLAGLARKANSFVKQTFKQSVSHLNDESY